MDLTYTCLYCGHRFRPRKDVELSKRICGHCSTRVILPTEEYDALVRKIGDGLRECNDQEWVPLSNALKDVKEFEDGMFWITRMDHLIEVAKKRYL